MSDTGRKIMFSVLATLGAMAFVASIAIQLWGAWRHQPIEIPHAVYYAGMLLGFVGFYGLDPTHAKDGGKFIVDSIVKLIRGKQPTTELPAVKPPQPPVDQG